MKLGVQGRWPGQEGVSHKQEELSLTPQTLGEKLKVWMYTLIIQERQREVDP